MHCAIETGGFEHELHAILGEGWRTPDAAVATAIKVLRARARALALAEARAVLAAAA